MDRCVFFVTTNCIFSVHFVFVTARQRRCTGGHIQICIGRSFANCPRRLLSDACQSIWTSDGEGYQVCFDKCNNS